MKFKICWIAYINPETICNRLGINPYEIDSKEYPKNYKKVLKEILDYLPERARHSGELMGDWEFECYDNFEADNIEEAKKKALEYDVGINGVFTVLDESLITAFTEEDCY